MTLQYLGTARINATPLARHIDKPEQQAPVYTCLDTLIADMMADAKQIQAAMSRHHMTETQKTSYAKEVTNESIVQCVEDTPGITIAEMAQITGTTSNILNARLITLCKWGCVSFKWRPGKTKKVKTFYRVDGVPVEKPDYTKHRNTGLRAKTLAFIRANPGCTTHEIAEHLGKLPKNAATIISNARQQGAPIVSKRCGVAKPSRHWVEAAQ